MVYGQPQISRRFCKQCAQHCVFERSANRLGSAEVILAMVTLGLYPVFKWVVRQVTDPWRCEHCRHAHRFWWRD